MSIKRKKAMESTIAKVKKKRVIPELSNGSINDLFSLFFINNETILILKS